MTRSLCPARHRPPRADPMMAPGRASARVAGGAPPDPRVRQRGVRGRPPGSRAAARGPGLRRRPARGGGGRRPRRRPRAAPPGGVRGGGAGGERRDPEGGAGGPFRRPDARPHTPPAARSPPGLRRSRSVWQARLFPRSTPLQLEAFGSAPLRGLLPEGAGGAARGPLARLARGSADGARPALLAALGAEDEAGAAPLGSDCLPEASAAHPPAYLLLA